MMMLSQRIPGVGFGILGWLLLAALPLNAQIPAFPGAEGYGSHATGGRGGDVYVVTNLNASGAGSFADAVSTAPVAGRTIVFAVSGHIRLPSGSGGGLTISKNKITVAGQTAPGDGVCFWNNTTNLTGDNLVLRHLRWRYGKQAAGGDAVDISGSQHIILDHCEVMFSTDENLSSFGTPPEYFTFQWSINAWGLQSHSAGGLWSIDHATAHHTLWANNHTRNPKCIAPSVFDWTNNVTFGWNLGFNLAESPTGGTGYVHRVNVRGSTFSHGGATSSAFYGGGSNSDGTNKFKLHMSDSALDGNNNGVFDVSRTNYQMVSSTSYDQAATAWPQTVNGVSGGAVIGVPVLVDARLTAYKKVLSKVGAVRMEYDAGRPLRDEITQLCVSRTAAAERRIISDPLQLGLSTGSAFAALNSATALADADKDGMPDTWETALGMNATLASHNTVFASSGGMITGPTFFPANTPAGYTHLEEYLHFKAQPHAVMPRNTAAAPSFLEVDLSRYTSGFTSNPVFVLANVVGGSVAQSGAGGKIVRFTPTLDSFGRAKFDFTVTDSAGSAWTQQFFLLVTASAIPRDLVWVGNGSTNPWETTSSTWSRSGVTTSFNNGDFVSFDDGGSATPAIAITGSLQPSAMLVDASVKNYTLTGGTLTGGMALTKRGGGVLTLRSNLGHTGGTTMEDGGLVLGLVGTAANSTGNVGSSALTLLGDATVTNAWFGTQLPLSAPIVVPQGSEPTINTGRNIRFSGALTGEGNLTLNNQTVPGNTFELTGPWAGFMGTLRINYAGTNAGIRTIFNGGAFNGFNGATLDLGGGNSINPVTNSGGNTFNIGALKSMAVDAILNGGTAGAANYVVGGLNQTTTFAGKFQGNATLTKTGGGTLTLNGASTHNGATAVNQGALMVNGSFGASAVSVANGATLGGGGNLGGSVSIVGGGIVDPVGTLATGPLTSSAAVLRFDLSSTAGGLNDRIAVTGNATITSTHTIEFNATDGVVGGGVYPLITTTGTLTAGSATFSHNLVNTPRQTFGVAAVSNALNLVVTGSPVSLVWSGGQTQWDVATTAAWLNNATSDVFYNADEVNFTDAATSGLVTLAATVAPRNVVINNTTRSFAFGGASLAGAAGLAKRGSGTVTFNAANTFTGGVLLDAGNIHLASVVANGGALGSGMVTLNGGILKLYSAGNDTHAGTFPNALHVAGSARFEVAPRCGFSGAVIGAGTLDYRTNYVRADVTGDWSGFTGQLNVTTSGNGDFRMAASYTWPGLPLASINLAAGTNFYMSGIVDDGAGTTISLGSLSGASGSALRGGITGSRTLTYRIGGKSVDAVFAGTIGEQGSTTTTALTKIGTATWTLSGTCNHRGATTVESGTLRLASTALLTQTSELTVQSGGTLELAGANVTAGGITISEGGTLNYSGGIMIGEASLGGTLNVNLVNVSGGQEIMLIQNTGSTPGGGSFADQPEGSHLVSNGQTFRLSYLGGDGNDVTLTALTGQETWRLTYFGSTQNTGNAADAMDPNGDGEINLLEFATGQSPHAATLTRPALVKNGATLSFTYTRSVAAVRDGVVFTVQWSDALAGNSWSDAGVTEQIMSDNGTLQSVTAGVNAGGARRFVRLKIFSP